MFSSEEIDLGVVCNAEEVKKFVKTIINSNITNEVWNKANQVSISDGRLNSKKRVPICIWGNHGIGKTELLKSLANELTSEQNRGSDEKWLFTNVAPAQFEEMGDLLGMPSIDPGKLDDPSDDKTIMVPPAWTPQKVEEARFETTKKNGPGIFLIDDINRADIRIISGIMQLLQDFELVSWNVPDDWQIVLTANPPGGGYIVREMDDAMLTRMMHIEMRVDEKVWAKWAEAQEIDSRGISFVLAYPELLEGRRTTPRTLVQFFNSIDGLDDFGDAGVVDMITKIGMSCLDKETVVEFIQFMRNDWSKIIQPEEILNSKDFKKVESKMNVLVKPKKGSKVKRVDAANIVVQRLINKVMALEDVLTKLNLANITSFFKLDSIPLDMKVASGRDLFNFTINKEGSDIIAQNRRLISKIFEDKDLALMILEGM
jgi:hypothetical protein